MVICENRLTSRSLFIVESCSDVQFHFTSFLTNAQSGTIIVDLFGMAKYLIMPSKRWREGMSVGIGMSMIDSTFMGSDLMAFRQSQVAHVLDLAHLELNFLVVETYASCTIKDFTHHVPVQ